MTDEFEAKAKIVIDDVETVVKHKISTSPRLRRFKERVTAAIAKAMKAADGLARKIDDLHGKEDDDAK